jgi:hypothetical protein
MHLEFAFHCKTNNQNDFSRLIPLDKARGASPNFKMALVENIND